MTRISISSFLIFSLFWNQIALAQNEFVSDLMRLDFDSAFAKARELDKNLNIPYHSFITKIIKSSGQHPKKDALIYTELAGVKDSNFLLDLSLGLYNLYNNPDHSIAFEKLIESLNRSKAQDLCYQKLIYLALLEVYGQEIVQSNSNYLVFLEDFLDISNDLLSLTWYHIHRIRYYSKLTQGDYKTTFTEEFKIFNTFFRNNENNIPQKVFGYYYYYKAIYLKTNSQFGESKNSLIRFLDSYCGTEYFRYNCFISNLFLCEIEASNGNLDKAKSYLKSAKSKWNKSDIIRSRYLFDRYSSFYYFEKIGDYKTSFELIKKSIADEVNIDFRNSTFLIAEGNLKYQTAEKEKQILVEQQKVRTNRNWLIAAILALLLGSGIAVLLQKNTSKKRQLAEQEALLKQQRVDNLLKEQELLSIDAMIAGQEKERQKVAGELHDDLGSLMATIKLHFDNAKVSKQDPALQNAQKLLEEAYQKIRGMAHSKNSGVMSDQGLLSAIKKMAQTITETNALEVTVEDFGLGERMENSLELSIFRIVQELVTNAIKHAEASKVTIQLTQHDDNLNIIVEDDGLGFDSSKVEKRDNGMGLTTIEKRVEHLEGNFTIDSLLGKGTSILIDIPI